MSFNEKPRSGIGSLQESIQDFPKAPGVYIMKDKAGIILYVGKAKQLLARVRSYFGSNLTIKTAAQMKRVQTIEYIVTQNEHEALLLESTLIKKWQPFFNIDLKDGKTFPSIRMTNEQFPRIFKTRRLVMDGSRYWGPFSHARYLTQYLEMLERIYPLRKCKGEVRQRSRPCLYWHIGRCSAPCAGKTTRPEYLENVDKICRLLDGDTTEMKQELHQKIEAASKELQFEKAADLRNVLYAIQNLETPQQVVDHLAETRDYIGYVDSDNRAAFTIFQMREGKLIQSETYFTHVYGTAEENVRQFVIAYYDTFRENGAALIPNHIFVPYGSDCEEMGKILGQWKGDVPVEVSIPSEERDSSLLQMAAENAKYELLRATQKDAAESSAMEELQQLFKMAHLPRRIEGFDIAHVEGKYMVASMVLFMDGRPAANEYRQFNIERLMGKVDDYKAIEEAVARRYTRSINENYPLPELILIDGGKGQVNAAHEILKVLNIAEIPIIGLAKRNEEIFLPHVAAPIRLPRRSPALRLLQQVRDEAHRFATSRRAARHAHDIRLERLQHIPGIGTARAKLLIRQYGSIENIVNGTPDQIAATCKISPSLAHRVIEALTRDED